jgi:hypothetical protein
MNPEKSHRNKPKHQFAGCIEITPPLPEYIEFIDAHRSWGFPIVHLKQFVLQAQPQEGNQKTAPPDQLILVYPTALVVLVGWRLELMIGPLICGRVARVHAERHLGPLMIEEAWVSEIEVLPNDLSVLRPETRRTVNSK